MKKLLLFIISIGFILSANADDIYYLKNTTGSAITLNAGIGTLAAGDSTLLYSNVTIANLLTGKLAFLKYAVDEGLNNVNYLLSVGSLSIHKNGIALSQDYAFIFLGDLGEIYKNYLLPGNSKLLQTYQHQGTGNYYMIWYDLSAGFIWYSTMQN
jgi:hypothetical protein